jgi:hypothetical protein
MFRKRPPAVASSTSSSRVGERAHIRRQFERLIVDLPGTYSLAEHEDAHASRLINLSAGGVCLMADEDLAAGTVVRIHFALGGQEIPAAGRVAMSFRDGKTHRFGHGIAFTAFENPRDQEYIARYVADALHKG